MSIKYFVFNFLVGVLFSSRIFSQDLTQEISKEVASIRGAIQKERSKYSGSTSLSTAQLRAQFVTSLLASRVPILQLSVVRAFQDDHITSEQAVELIKQIASLLDQPPFQYSVSEQTLDYKRTRDRGVSRGFMGLGEPRLEPALVTRDYWLPAIAPQVLAALAFTKLELLVKGSPLAFLPFAGSSCASYLMRIEVPSPSE